MPIEQLSTDLLLSLLWLFAPSPNAQAPRRCSPTTLHPTPPPGQRGVCSAPRPTADMLRKEIAMLKERLDDKTRGWIGGSARKTNKDYTGGHFPELVDIIIKEKARLFKFHAAGILVMNMIGEPRHVEKALAQGPAACPQGTEAGGHSGEIATLPLIPQCVDRCRGRTSPLHGGPIHVVAAGGIYGVVRDGLPFPSNCNVNGFPFRITMYDGRGLAAAMSLGARAVWVSVGRCSQHGICPTLAWVGTRFVASKESAGSKMHKKSLIEASATDTIRTLVFSGRPVRAYKSPYVMDWEEHRQDEIKDLCSKGVVPLNNDFDNFKSGKVRLINGKRPQFSDIYPRMFGQACGGITEILPAREIIQNMVNEAVARRVSAAARAGKGEQAGPRLVVRMPMLE
eukprot:gene38027-59724_t